MKNQKNINAQEQLIETKIKLNNQYPDKNVQVMDLNRERLVGHLDISDYPNLIELDCHSNQLTSLDLSKNKKLTKLICARNDLTSLNLTACANSLTYLSISANPNLIIKFVDFNHLVNLETLYCIGTKLATQLEDYGQPEDGNYISLLKK
jgi:Leucine-rich repeat (LRR) protein